MNGSDTLKNVAEYIRRKYGIKPDYPFEDDTPVFRHTDNGKWFAIVIRDVPNAKLCGGEGRSDVINFKCDPLLASCVADGKRIFPAYHMNKRHWISVMLDGSVSADEISAFADLSYKLTGQRSRNDGKGYNETV